MTYRPYRHYSDKDLFTLQRELEEDTEYAVPSSYALKQLVLVEAEISEREFELEDF